VCGADSASLYLEVKEVVGEHDVVCEAKNDALLDGLLTVFHAERSQDEVVNVQVGGGMWRRGGSLLAAARWQRVPRVCGLPRPARASSPPCPAGDIGPLR
jgi:hypothetical protein